ncbi:MAG: hypothetical protein HYU55_02015 [Nocardioides sp.]|nr:hypothetical protein [Nocardioides sp.]
MREQMDHQVENISRYVEGQARGETVEHAERMISTKVAGSEHEVWDVRTDKDRYWVVTNPTNLYSQDEFKSADYSLTFHIGLGLRIMERSRIEVDEDIEDQVDVAWRKFQQAVDAFNSADEAEAYQAVGVRCREAQIALGRRIAGQISEEELPERPKASNFKAWADHGAERFATGRLRAYLKGVADKSWDLAVWLQHFEDATPWDAELVLDATSHVLSMYGTAMIRHERGAPARCPRCASYRVEWDGGLTDEDPDVQWQQNVCGACEHRWGHQFIRLEPGEGWVPTDPPQAQS